MSLPIQPPQDGTAESTPAITNPKKAGFTPLEPVSPLVIKLSALRAKYLEELQTARNKVKQNFLGVNR